MLPNAVDEGASKQAAGFMLLPGLSDFRGNRTSYSMSLAWCLCRERTMKEIILMPQGGCVLVLCFFNLPFVTVHIHN